MSRSPVKDMKGPRICPLSEFLPNLERTLFFAYLLNTYQVVKLSQTECGMAMSCHRLAHETLTVKISQSKEIVVHYNKVIKFFYATALVIHYFSYLLVQVDGASSDLQTSDLCESLREVIFD